MIQQTSSARPNSCAAKADYLVNQPKPHCLSYLLFPRSVPSLQSYLLYLNPLDPIFFRPRRLFPIRDQRAHQAHRAHRVQTTNPAQKFVNNFHATSLASQVSLATPSDSLGVNSGRVQITDRCARVALRCAALRLFDPPKTLLRHLRKLSWAQLDLDWTFLTADG